MNDLKSILAKSKKGNNKAQYLLFKYSYPFLMSMCLRYKKNKDDAEAMLNEGFYKILKGLKKWKKKQEYEVWAKRIMLNTLIDDYRKNKKHQTTEVFSDIVDEEFENKVFIEENTNLEIEELLELIHSLPEIECNIFNLFELEGYNHPEIADMLEISVRSSKRHLQKARITLRTKIEAMSRKDAISIAI